MAAPNWATISKKLASGIISRGRDAVRQQPAASSTGVSTQTGGTSRRPASRPAAASHLPAGWHGREPAFPPQQSARRSKPGHRRAHPRCSTASDRDRCRARAQSHRRTPARDHIRRSAPERQSSCPRTGCRTSRRAAADQASSRIDSSIRSRTSPSCPSRSIFHGT